MSFNKIGVTAAALLLTVSANAYAGLITNGSFEDPGLTSKDWQVFSTGIPGWEVQSGAGIEIQNNTIINAYDGDQYVELDSHNNSTMFQLVDNLIVGDDYMLSFAYAPRVSSSWSLDSTKGQTVNTNGINVYFGSGGELLNLNGIFTDNQSGWSLFSTTITATASIMQLTFEADGTSDSYGGFIDSVELHSVPEPSILALFGLGFAGMGFVSRRRKQS